MKEVSVAAVGRRVRGARLDLGEASVIFLALELKALAVIDDRRARAIAISLGVRTIGTPHILRQLVLQRALTVEEAKEGIDRMIREGWRCSPTHYAQVMRFLEEAGPP